MISRRNIRVKVMQLLYMIEAADNTAAFARPVDTLQKQIDKSRELFVYLIYFLTEVARYAETSARKRASRNLPSAEDLNVNTKIAGNELLWQILESGSFQQSVEKDLPGKRIDRDLVKKLYEALTETDVYKEYISQQSRQKAKEKEIMRVIFQQLMLPDESFTSHIEEQFPNWDDDSEMMDQLVMNYLQKPVNITVQEIISAEKWLFARTLLTTAIEKKEYCAELIKPKLKNWDSERIAVLDMVLMRMGVCELLYFETIPTKVTINEYIDLAKEYSTPQSGQFVNGILDNIHKELLEAGKIQKINFKK
ncbi:transcription antitermination factor NusB [Sediminibacterium soli]|uniref:transcription antitermination factor NusB n=1 Tax=Sediminibacterium soli TaxID=2698829 RepID=UPI00137AAEBF|nr:transcription antitermination factor NusB [Sediminibacterium soli]NCI46246.1 transcription antitermination factor NusB [Sediminibacterium soli]